MTYPGAIDSFTTKVDDVDDVLAAHINDLQDALVNTQTELGTDPAGSATDLKTRLANALNAAGFVNLKASTILTIASGVITTTQNFHRVDTESSAASDDLDTISAAADGFVLFLRTVNDGRDVVIQHGTGNIVCTGGQSVTLGLTSDLAILIYDGVLSKWIALGLTGAGVLNAANTWTGHNEWNAGETHKYNAITGDETLDDSYFNVSADASGGAFTITLPPASGLAGTEYFVVKADDSANAVTIDGDGTETINGALTKVLSAQYAGCTLVCDGSGWLVKQ